LSLLLLRLLFAEGYSRSWRAAWLAGYLQISRAGVTMSFSQGQGLIKMRQISAISAFNLLSTAILLRTSFYHIYGVFGQVYGVNPCPPAILI